MIKVNHSFTYLWVKDIKGWIINNNTLKVLALNQTSLEIFKLMLDNKSAQEIAIFLSKKYNEEDKIIIDHVNAIFNKIIDFGVFNEFREEIKT